MKNRLGLLRQTIDSVETQTFEHWEHIIVDDGSDDDVAQEVERLAAARPRIRYLKRRSPGANACRNLGILHSRGELVVLLDSDDLLAPHCLRQRVDAMQRNQDLDFAVFPGRVFSETAEDSRRLFSPVTAGSDLDRFLYLEHPWQTSGPIWRRSAIEKVGLFSEGLMSWQDVDLHVRALAAGLKYLKYDTPDHYVRWSAEPGRTSFQQFRTAAHLSAGPAIVEGFRARLADSGLMTWGRRRALGGLLFLLAERWIRIGNLTQGLRVWRGAFGKDYVPLRVYAGGLAVLIAFKLNILGPSYTERLLERFKYAVRFRSEPAL